MKPTKQCFQCGNDGFDMYDVTICDTCKNKLGLFTDKKIMGHIEFFSKTKDISYLEEIEFKLDHLEKDFIKKKIKLMHIRDRVRHLQTK